jgi:hypothetical protein
VRCPDDLSLCHQIIDEQQSTIDQLQRELAQAEHFVEQLLLSPKTPLGLLSSVVVNKYSDHLPLYQLEDVFGSLRRQVAGCRSKKGGSAKPVTPICR